MNVNNQTILLNNALKVNAYINKHLKSVLCINKETLFKVFIWHDKIKSYRSNPPKS